MATRARTLARYPESRVVPLSEACRRLGVDTDRARKRVRRGKPLAERVVDGAADRLRALRVRRLRVLSKAALARLEQDASVGG